MSNRARLTETMVRDLKPDPKNKIRIWDTGLPGFGVYVTPKGSKSFFVNYRTNGKERRATIGKVGHTTVIEARKLAARTLADVTEGKDPLQEKQRLSATMTFKEFWKLYTDDAWPRWKGTTRNHNQRIWEKTVPKKLKTRRIDTLRVADFAALHRSLKETPAHANLTARVLKAAFNKAIEWELLESNPVKIKPYPMKKRERFLTSEEFRILFEAIALEEDLGGKRAVKRQGESKGQGGKGKKETESRGISPHSATLFRLLILTGCRLGEIKDARWDYVRWEDGVLELPDSKTGRKRVVLSSFALQELEKLLKIKTKGNPYIIEGIVTGKQLNNAQRPWRRVKARAGELLNKRREEANLEQLERNPFDDVRIHDLRHSFASVAVTSGMGLPIIGKALGHSQSSTTERYAHLANDPVKEAVEMIGAKIIENITQDSAIVETISKELE